MNSSRKVLISGMIGNGLEWYDYALYGHFATIISKLFFPAENAYISLIATFGVFAAGFVMRPVGAIIFGYIGDKFGRRLSLAISIIMMAIPTACIGLLPTYAQIGILAPILLTIVRLLQGLSLGGELSGSIAYVVESSPSDRRGLSGSSAMFSMAAGILLGSGVATLFAEILTPAAFESWGWRIPFVLGMGIGLVGLYIRSHLAESPLYLKAKKHGLLSKKPLREVCTFYWKEMLAAIGIYLTVTVPFYILVVFMNSFMSKVLGHPVEDALLINTISMVVLIIFGPLSGLLSDKIGRKPILITVSIGFMVLSYPLFWLLCQPGFMAPLIAQMIFAILVAFYIGPVPAVLVELFPTSVRYSGMALSYNLCAAIFGGTAPMVATWLIQTTKMNTIVAVYVIICAIVSLITLYYYKDNYRKALS